MPPSFHPPLPHAVEPPPGFQARAAVGSLAAYRAIRHKADADPVAYWAEAARESLAWARPFKEALDESHAPFYRWFADGELNACTTCLDRHADGEGADRHALVWEGEDGAVRALTYEALRRQVAAFARVLGDLGVRAGDRVAIVLPAVPEAAVAMLACARLGAIHDAVSPDFGADALKGRIAGTAARVVITADGGMRRGRALAIKPAVDAAIAAGPAPAAVVVVRRTGQDVEMVEGRDRWWDALMAEAGPGLPATPQPAEHPLFVLYTSGATDEPRGTVHATAGFLVHAAVAARLAYDVRPGDVVWCTSGLAGIDGHVMGLYGTLANGATAFLAEAGPLGPAAPHVWDVVARHGVTTLLTTPTVVRGWMAAGEAGEAALAGHDLRRLRLLGTTGEPLAADAWRWLDRVVGQGQRPIVDAYWQTEAGGPVIAPFPGATPIKPGSPGLPLPGVAAVVVDEAGHERAPGERGLLAVRGPWPGMARTLLGDPDRWVATYWQAIPGCFATGDGAWRDADGYVWPTGRVDETLNVAGHRLGPGELEAALRGHPAVADAAVVARPDARKGQAVVAFVVARPGHRADPELAEALKGFVVGHLGGVARPDEVRFADALPRTADGAVARRELRARAFEPA